MKRPDTIVDVDIADSFEKCDRSSKWRIDENAVEPVAREDSLSRLPGSSARIFALIDTDTTPRPRRPRNHSRPIMRINFYATRYVTTRCWTSKKAERVRRLSRGRSGGLVHGQRSNCQLTVIRGRGAIKDLRRSCWGSLKNYRDTTFCALNCIRGFASKRLSRFVSGYSESWILYTGWVYKNWYLE